MNQYSPYDFPKTIRLLEKYLFLGATNESDDEYDVFDMQIHPIAAKAMKDIATNGYQGYDVFSEQNYRYMNTFNGYAKQGWERVFLYTEVMAEEETTGILAVLSGKGGKVWVNGVCVSIHNNEYMWSYHDYYSVPFHKGKNTILYEQHRPDAGAFFSLQLRNCELETQHDDRALHQTGSAVKQDPLELVCPFFYQPSGDTYTFMCLKNGAPIGAEYQVCILDSVKGEIRRCSARLGEPFCLDIKSLRELDPEVIRYEWIECRFVDANGKDHVNAFALILNTYEERRLAINQIAKARMKEAPYEVAVNMGARLHKQEAVGYDPIAQFWYVFQLFDLLKQYDDGKLSYQEIQTEGIHDFYVHSDLDDSAVRILIRVPKGYHAQRPYPVIFSFNMGNDGGFCFGPLSELLDEPCLCCDVTGRGFTGGSYVGEASILEMIKWVRTHYTVDDERIYFLGQSNGGYASFAIAQNYPHLPAAIFPQIGYPHMDTIHNLSNTPTYLMVSPKDYVFTGRENEIRTELAPYGKIFQYDFEDMTHHHFTPYIYHKSLWNEMLKQKRDAFPRKITFTTNRNRHLESFWIKLHGMEMGAKTAHICAQIQSASAISIHMEGASGVTVTIPPQIDRNEFSITLNDSVMTFHNYREERVMLGKQAEWTLLDGEPLVDYRKGTGLLDVYLGSLRIVLPQTASKAMRNVAEHFSEPFSNGAEPKLYVKYPIWSTQVSPSEIFAHNVVLIDHKGDNELIEIIRGKLLVSYDENGYEYNGKYCQTPYLLLQAIPNPYHPERTVVVLSTNDEKLCHCFLIRKIILPYYISGVHPYLNNAAMIYDGKKYYGIYEAGGTMTAIS